MLSLGLSFLRPTALQDFIIQFMMEIDSEISALKATTAPVGNVASVHETNGRQAHVQQSACSMQATACNADMRRATHPVQHTACS
jgi:hypothetical protein